MKLSSLETASVSTGSLILINSSHPYCEYDSPGKLVSLGEGSDSVMMERRAAVLLSRLMDDIHGWKKIATVSGWRSKQEQQELWDDSISQNGKEFTQKFVAAPGCSEHQTGLAIDLGLRQDNIDFIRPDFPYNGICQAFRKNAARYGFIQRYPSGKEHITGIAHEPWHFRYVGVPHAELITSLGITLEEYLELLRRYPINQKPLTYNSGTVEFSVSYLPIDWQSTEIPEEECILSGDNQAGLIVTKWRNREY